MPLPSKPIPALLPRSGRGHQFVCYADCCSGVAGALHESTFAAVNAVVRRLDPQPEFICFPGDEIIGLTADDDELRRQWHHWFDVEMAWLDRAAIPLYHTTGNHTAYDSHSEAVYRAVMAHLPKNGAPGQEGLSYLVRRDDLLLIFVNTLCTELGGEGYVETAWLEQTLIDHADARHKLVFGHHPIFPVNGYVGEHSRTVDTTIGQSLWALLVQHGVLAYVCSHILAFDVQVHQGVLQILTAGAGTAHRMPDGIEYLHAVQAALDEEGLRYQVLDTDGVVRERLSWPLPKGNDSWHPLPAGQTDAPISGTVNDSTVNDSTVNDSTVNDSTGGAAEAQLVRVRFSGRCADATRSARQTLLSAWDRGPALAPIWIGLAGVRNQLVVSLAPTAGRSPHLWYGPTLEDGKPFAFEIAIHTGMGPGGLLWRWNEKAPWSSMAHTAAWGAERLTWPALWSVGHGQRGKTDAPFQGDSLAVAWQIQRLD